MPSQNSPCVDTTAGKNKGAATRKPLATCCSAMEVMREYVSLFLVWAALTAGEGAPESFSLASRRRLVSLHSAASLVVPIVWMQVGSVHTSSPCAGL